MPSARAKNSSEVLSMTTCHVIVQLNGLNYFGLIRFIIILMYILKTLTFHLVKDADTFELSPHEIKAGIGKVRFRLSQLSFIYVGVYRPRFTKSL